MSLKIGDNMYFNDEKNSTNIDKEFESNKKFNFDINILKNKYVLIGIGCFLVLIFMVFIFSKKPVVKTEYFLELEGLTDMTIYQDSVFIDPGYKAYDNKGVDYTLDVSVLGLVDTSVVGEYIIEYQFNDIVKRRVVTVLGDVTHVTYLNLLGTSIVYLNIGAQYIEPGYVVLDSVDENLENRVVIDGKVNTDVAGTYKLIYSVINSSGVTVSEERTVIVMDSDISLSYSPIEYTSSDVEISVDVTANYFDYVLLPDGTESKERNIKFTVSENGEYLFTIYNVDGSNKSAFIVIDNIDKVLPNGSCTAIYNGKTTNINVYANDSSGINSYSYIINNKGVGSTNNGIYNYNGNGKTVLVDIMDNTGNVKRINCKYSETLSNTIYSMIVSPKPANTIPCGMDVTSHNRKLNNKVKSYGYKTRASVVAAARYLTTDLGYLVEYW